MSDPTTVATAWMDQAWDPAVGLLWNAPGAFDDVAGPRTVHLVRETAWYALGLLRRDQPGDAERAAEALDAVCAHQYDEPGQPWHGTFVRFPEWAPPQEGAVEWVDYDPNWRQFLGTALAVAVTDFALPAHLDERARRGPVELRWESNTDAVEADAGRWSFPGLDVLVTTDARLVDAASRTYAPVGDATRMTLTLA